MSTASSELFHYCFWWVLCAFTYHHKETPVFGAAQAFWCMLLSCFGLPFRQITTNLANPNDLTAANAPFFYQIAGTWSNHEGSISSWCLILGLYGFLLCYRAHQSRQPVSTRVGPPSHTGIVDAFVSTTFVKHYGRSASLPSRTNKLGAADPVVVYHRSWPVDELCFMSLIRQTPVSGLVLRGFPKALRLLWRGEYVGRDYEAGRKNAHWRLTLGLNYDDQEKSASYLVFDEQRVALGIALFFYPFLSSSSDPFVVRDLFVRPELLAESNPVPQDPISAIHPPCIYAGYVASAMVFVLGLSEMLHGIVSLTRHGCVRLTQKGREGSFARDGGAASSGIGIKLVPRRANSIKPVGKVYTALSLSIPGRISRLRSPLRLLLIVLPGFDLPSSLAGSAGSLVDTGSTQSKRVVVRHVKKEPSDEPPHTSPLSRWLAANTVVSEPEPLMLLWLSTCRCFLTVGIFPGSWWAHHELGRGGWWFRDPVENASFMPRVLATARLHSVMLPILHSWTSFMNSVTLPCCVSGTSSIRSGLLAPVHNFSDTDATRGLCLGWFLLLLTGIAMILFSRLLHLASVRRTNQKELVVARRTLVLHRLGQVTRLSTPYPFSR